MIRFFFFVTFFCLSSFNFAHADENLAEAVAQDLYAVVDEQVVEPFEFYGLAAYYNEATPYFIQGESIKKFKKNKLVTLGPDDWLIISGRFNVLVVQANGLSVSKGDDNILVFDDTGPLLESQTRVQIVSKPELKTVAPVLNKVRYAHLMLPMRMIALALEKILIWIHAVVGGWGAAIIGMALFLNIIFLPLKQLTRKYQSQVSKTQALLEPRLAEIKANYKGEAAHKLFISAHKELGVTTFFALKPMIGLMIQIPVWIAVFNVLAEMPQLSGHGYLWMKDLAYPDAIANWGTHLPLVGDSLNLMPILMTFITILSTLAFRNNDASNKSIRKQKRNLFLMAGGFLILFYPFPSGMVFYWTLANLLSFIQQMFLQINHKE